MSSSSRKMLQAAAGNAGGADFYPYTVDYSARFNDDGDAKMYRTHSTPTSDQKFTYSTWFKHSNVSTDAGVFFYVRNSAWNRYFAIFAYPPSGGYNGRIYISCNPNGTVQDVAPSALFRDFSAWYHLVLAVDSTESTATDRVKVYINGERVTDWISGTAPNNVTLNQSIAALQSGGITAIGGRDDVANVQKYDGYLSQTAYIDGTAYTATDFGESKNGVWIPKDISGLSFGNNGYYLDYASSSALGNDVSGNNNDLTTSGLTSSDQTIDTPTNNHCVLNPLWKDASTSGSIVFSEGNTVSNTQGTGGQHVFGTMAIPSTGKWYFEVECTDINPSFCFQNIGLSSQSASARTVAYSLGDVTYAQNGNKYINGTGSAYGSSFTTGDVIGVACDSDSGTVTFYKNNSSQGSISTNPAGLLPFTGDSVSIGYSAILTWNFSSASFTYTPPTNHLALCTANLPEPTIGPNSAIKPEDCFATVLYTGNGTAIGSGGNAITGVGFQPDMVWIKNRDAADQWMVFDSVRGATKYLSLDDIDVEVTDTESLNTFDTDGFTLGNNVAVNTSGEDYVAYCFKITAGFFDIQTYAGTGVAKTVSHDLGVVPNMMIVKSYNGGYQWPVYCSSLPVADPETDYLQLNTRDAVADANTMWNDTAPTSTVFTVGTAGRVNDAAYDFIAYLFADVEGFCKTGYYKGNGSADGPFEYLGFSPELHIIKQTNADGGWFTLDTEREPYNPTKTWLYLDTNGSENSADIADLNSNGSKLRFAGGGVNVSSNDYITLSIGTSSKYSNAR